LFTAIRSEFEKISEFRTGDVEISMGDALMSAFAMFSLKDPSLLQFDSRREDLAECQNLKSIYGIRNIPSDSRMREIWCARPGQAWYWGTLAVPDGKICKADNMLLFGTHKKTACPKSGV